MMGIDGSWGYFPCSRWLGKPTLLWIAEASRSRSDRNKLSGLCTTGNAGIVTSMLAGEN